MDAGISSEAEQEGWQVAVDRCDLLLAGLDGGEGDGVEDVFNQGAAGEVVDGAFHALQHGADADDVGAALNGFVGGIAGVEVGEDEHGGFAGDGTVGGFGRGDVGDGGGVVLEGAVEEEVGTFLLGQLGGLADFVDVGSSSGFAGGVADHGDACWEAEGDGGVGALNGDVGEGFGVGIGIDGAVAVNEDLVGEAHEEDGGDNLGTGFGFDDLQGGPDGVGGGVNGTGDETVDFAEGEHDGAEPDMVVEEVGGGFGGEAFVFAHFDEGADVVLADVGGVEDFDVGREFDLLAFGNAVDFFGVADEDAAGDAALGAEGGGADGAGFVAFGEDDAFVGGAGEFGEFEAEGGGGEAGFDGDGGVGGDPCAVDVAGDEVHAELDAFEVVGGDLVAHFGDVGGGVPAVGFDVEDGEAGFDGGSAEVEDAGGDFGFAGEQEAGEVDVVEAGKAGGDDDIAAVGGGDEKVAGHKRVEHVGHGAGEQVEFFDATRFHFAFKERGGVEVAGDVDGAAGADFGVFGDGTDEVEAGAADEATVGAEFVDECRERFVVGVGDAVDDAADDGGAIDAAEGFGGVFEAGFKFVEREAAEGAGEDDFGAEGFGELEIEVVGVGVVGRVDETFDDDDIGIGGGLMVDADDAFEEFVDATGGDKAFGLFEGDG